jgi:acetoin utilization deacetylase AcuC-like enzyme
VPLAVPRAAVLLGDVEVDAETAPRHEPQPGARPGTGDKDWLAAVGSLIAAVQRFGPDALVLSLGVDAAADDPESPLQVTASACQGAGAKVSRVAPTVVVLEGGYALPTLGSFVAATLVGLERGE